MADIELIKWLFENRTQYYISKETGVNQSSLSKFMTGKRDIMNMALGTAIKLTEFALKEKAATQK